MEQRWKLPHLFHNGASSCSMDVGEQQQLCCREVHLLLFQKSLGRELLTEAGIHRPGWCCPCRLGGFLIASSNSSLWPSERQCCLWAMCQTLCATWPCVCSSQVTEDTLTNTGWPKEGRAAVWYHTQGCHCTLAEDSAKWDLHTRAQSLGVFPTLPRVLPLLQVSFLLVFLSLRHGHWKRSNGFETWSKNSGWIPRSGWMTLRISVFTGSAKFDSYCWWHSQP